MAAFEYFYPTCDDLCTLIFTKLPLSVSLESRERRDNMIELLLTSPHLTVLFDVKEDPEQNGLSSVLPHVLKVSETETLQTLAQSLTGSISVLMSPALTLLTKLQRFLLAKPNGGRVLNGYILQVFESCSKVLMRALEVCDQNRQSVRLILSALQVSLVGVALPSILSWLSFAPLSSFSLSLAEIREPFLSLLNLIDRLNRLSDVKDYSSNEMIGFHRQAYDDPSGRGWGKNTLDELEMDEDNQEEENNENENEKEENNGEVQMKIIESAHPYKKETLDQTIQFRGATSIAVLIDPRSCSKNANDVLKISQSSPRWQLTASGPPEGDAAPSRWPPRLIRRRGDSINFYWHVEKDDQKESKNSWGFRCVVYGFVPQSSPPEPSPTRCSTI